MTKSSKISVFALFDDSTADEVIYSYFGAPSSQDIPIRTFSNDIRDADVQRSVLDGASAALASFERHFKSSGERYCFAYKFLKDETNQAITGKSAGLAFCLKFSIKLYKDLIPDQSDFSVAATGVLEINEDITHIRPVEKINNKLEAALKSLNSGDILLYPQDNEDQLDQKLKRKIIDKGISVNAVTNVNQVIEIFFKGYIKESVSDATLTRMKTKWAIIPALVIILSILFYLVFFRQTESCYGVSLKYLEAGEFILAKDRVGLCLQETDNDSLQYLLQKIESNLTLSSNFIYIKNTVSKFQVEDDEDPLLLGPEDGYRFEIESSLDCFLYILQFDSETKTEKLFPLSPFILDQHHLQKNEFIKVPGGENMFYLSDKNHHGIVTIFIIASLWRLKDLEEIFNQYEDIENRQRKRNLYNELINRIKHYTDIKNSNINCLYLKELSFIQK